MEIPFKFVVPRNQGPRDSLIGGEPILTLWYSHYNLPDEAKAAIEKSQLRVTVPVGLWTDRTLPNLVADG